MAARKSKAIATQTAEQKRRAELIKLGLCTSDHNRKAESRGQCSDCCKDREDDIASGRATELELVADFWITPRAKAGRPRRDDRHKVSAFAAARSGKPKLGK